MFHWSRINYIYMLCYGLAAWRCTKVFHIHCRLSVSYKESCFTTSNAERRLAASLWFDLKELLFPQKIRVVFREFSWAPLLPWLWASFLNWSVFGKWQSSIIGTWPAHCSWAALRVVALPESRTTVSVRMYFNALLW